MSARSVLREHAAAWQQPNVYVGDTVFLTLPSAPSTGAVSCHVQPPDGEPVEVNTRRRDGLTGDVCAELVTSTEGLHRWTWTLPNGKKASGSFIAMSFTGKAKFKGRRR